MASKGSNLNASQFYITVGERLPALDGKHTVFGEVAEGLDALLKINDSFTDEEGRPLKVVRIRHTVVLHDPFDDPRGLEIPDQSPPPTRDTKLTALEDDEDIEEDIPQEELQKRLAEKEARARAEVLTMVCFHFHYHNL
jgi:peptidyl-prolyl cis-trans isomerase-like 4